MNGKTPLLLLPGMLCDAELWSHQIDTLSDVADITVADLTRDDSMEGMAERVLASAPERFAMAGLSMGGYVAQEIMRRAPERVSRLALLDTSSNVDTPGQTERRKGFMAQVREGEFKGVTARLMPLLIHADRLAESALTIHIQLMAERIGKEAFLRQQTAIMNRHEGFADLARVTCPSLILCGRQDALTPLEQHQDMAAAIPGASLVVIEDCGHLAPMEHPLAVSAVMRYWLQV